MSKYHTPVLVKEVLQFLDPKPNEDFIDCTLGLGGHAQEILMRTAPRGKLLAIDQDQNSLDETKTRLNEFNNRMIFSHGNFANLDQIAKTKGFDGVSGILFDLGLALWQIKSGGYGFSFEEDVPLDMRMFDARQSASEIINKYHFDRLANIFYQYGDLVSSRALARKIIQYREKKPIRTTRQLREVLQISNPKILARIFQALRIEVNDELENLKKALKSSIQLLRKGGRLVVISFHSGEDRIVKNFLRDNPEVFQILTKKPIIAESFEVKSNPRARSAKMRAAERII